MSLNEESSSEAFFPVSMEENSSEARTEGFRQEEGVDQNEDLLPELMEFLLETEIPWAEIHITSCEFASIPPENESFEAEIDDGLLMLEELDRNELFPELNQFLGFEEELQIQCAETTNSEQDPTLEQSSGENQVSDLKENNGRGKDEIQEMELQRKSSVSSESGLNDIRKQDCSGKCCECNKVYLKISKHNIKRHNRKLKKCTTSGCRKYFASALKRIEHEQEEHQERKKFRCQLCHYSTKNKSDLKRHVLRHHSEKKIKCGQQNCGKMFASETDLKQHVKLCHKMEKCPKCGRELSLASMYDHNRYGRCPGTVAK